MGTALVVATGVIPASAARPPAAACVGLVTSTLSVNGYQPGSLARSTETSADWISRAIQNACRAGTPAPLVAAQVLADQQVAVNDIATFLSVGFQEPPFGTASVLQAVGFDGSDIATALRAVFASTDGATAAILADLGFDATSVAGALLDAFDSDAPTTVGLLAQQGFAVPQVAAALRDARQASAAESGFWLLTAFRFSDIPEALEDAYAVSEEWAIGAWESTREWGIEFGTKFADEVMSVKDDICDELVFEEKSMCESEFWTLRNVWDWQWFNTKEYYRTCWDPEYPWDIDDEDPLCVAASYAGSFYRGIGVPAYEWAVRSYDWLQDPELDTPLWLTNALHEIGYGASETAEALKDVYEVSADWVVGAYHTVGYGASETAEALRDAYGVSADWVVGAYHTVGYGASETAEALRDVYEVSATWVAQALKDVGYAANEAGEALKDAYNWTEAQVNAFIDDLYDIGDDIGDWFCGWWGC